ncbi:MAG TPA: phenylalanine--tRNA ligase beta subunit-related protein, partial [bacterium]|nr:phenylalanine--tRNA ligase beta subunit-related protein [bacterium]
MKILYSQIKQLIPSLAATPAEIGAALTMTGFMQESLETVNYNNQADVLLGFEIRQNRPDCLSVIGLAREIAAYFNLSLNLPSTKEWTPAEVPVSIRVETPAVRRLKAIKLQDITVQASPQWLVDYLAFYEINSVNLPVDLSNYVMLLTGYPSHLIDYDRLDGDIVWS